MKCKGPQTESGCWDIHGLTSHSIMAYLLFPRKKVKVSISLKYNFSKRSKLFNTE